MEKIRCLGSTLFRFLLQRHEAFKTLPVPLRGKALCRKAKELGLVQRVEHVRVASATLKEECAMASTRMKLNMHEERGRECR